MNRLAVVLLVACANAVPETRYYALEPPPAHAARGDATLVVEPLATDSAYDDERIVYRTSPYRLDYYEYHRWSAEPGVLVADYLERALATSGEFCAVVREPAESAAVSLGGRVVAIEEVDRSKDRWVGHLVLELALTDTRTGEVVWRDRFDETEVMPRQSPEGLARALSVVMGRIAGRAAPAIAAAARERATLHARAGEAPAVCERDN